MTKWLAERRRTQLTNLGYRVNRHAPMHEWALRGLGTARRPSWWLVYGATRSGASYMYDLVKQCARLHVSDWGLGTILASVHRWNEFRAHPQHDYILFDSGRLLEDLSANILDHAYAGFGDQIDLAYKQATMEIDKVLGLQAMWGPPCRTIFCLREPGGYMASAEVKFPTATMAALQEAYVKSLAAFWQVRGDILEYRPGLTTRDYLEFLEPLVITGKHAIPFQYRGKQDLENVTDAMWEGYRAVQAAIAFNRDP